MDFEFKTARDIYGRRKYLWIIPDKKMYSTTCQKIIVDGIEIKTADYKALLEKCKKEKYTEF